MRILITGSSGFIGSNLLKSSRILSKHKVHLLQSDLRHHEDVMQEVEVFNPQIVIHLASRTEVEKSFYEQSTFSDVNYTGSVNLIEAVRKFCTDLKLFVQASTMETYGWQPVSDIVKEQTNLINPTEWFFDEDTEQNPNAPYAVAKLAVEKYLEYLHRSVGFPYIAIRTTNCYGRSDSNFFVTESVISQMIKGTTLNLGYAEPYRNFIYIDDVINLYDTIIDAGSDADIGAVTIGPNNPIKIRDYVTLIADQFSWDGDVNWNTRVKRPGEIFYLSSNYEKVAQKLAWSPKVPLDEGIRRTLEKWI